MTLRLGVLVSGSGSNLQAIIDAIADGSLAAEVVLVLSSRPDVFALERASDAGIETVALSPEDYADPVVADARIAQELRSRDVDYVVMAGYMRMLGPAVLAAFPDRVINLHPALLPSFPGADGIGDALAAGVKVTGVTVHFANEVYDEGPIIAQRAVPILEGDTVESLAARIHEVEHELLPEVLRLVSHGRVRLDADRIVRIAR